jgi:hypothetical protein
VSAVKLSELLELALAELDHPSDTAALDLWREKLKLFANDAIDDLTRSLRPWRRDPAVLSNGTVDLSTLPYPVSKALGVERKGLRIPFYYGTDVTRVHVKGVEDGPVDVVYRYLPAALENPNDVPQLPAACHPLIVLYMVARFQMHSDASGLSQSNLLMSLYERRKRRLRMDLDEPYGCTILNRY